MSAFESEDAFREFARTVHTEPRMVFDEKAGRFLASVRAASKSRSQSLKSGRRLWRAQVASDFVTRVRDDTEGAGEFEEEHPASEARMIPDAKLIRRGGRANRPGIAFLYLATNEMTALAEMRPGVGQSLTLAVFETQRELELVICQPGVDDLEERFLSKSPAKKMIDEWVWNDIGRAFSRPVNREDHDNAYLPTQLIAEALKAEGFDGLAYRSGLERGANVVLFEVQAAKLVQPAFAYTVAKVSYDFEAVPNHAICRQKDGKLHCLTEIRTESGK